MRAVAAVSSPPMSLIVQTRRRGHRRYSPVAPQTHTEGQGPYGAASCAPTAVSRYAQIFNAFRLILSSAVLHLHLMVTLANLLQCFPHLSKAVCFAEYPSLLHHLILQEIANGRRALLPVSPHQLT